MKPTILNNLRRINQKIITVSETEGDASLVRDRLSAVKREVSQARTIITLLDELERTRAAAKEFRKMAKECRWFLLNRDEWPTMATQESWNNTIQDTEWLEDLG